MGQDDDVIGSRKNFPTGKTATSINSHAEVLPPENNCIGIMSCRGETRCKHWEC